MTGPYANRGIPLPGLRLARQRLGLTQRDLATRAGMGQGTVSKLERLERGAYPKTLQKLAAALGGASRAFKAARLPLGPASAYRRFELLFQEASLESGTGWGLILVGVVEVYRRLLKVRDEFSGAHLRYRI